MQISEVTCLVYKDGPPVYIPDNLVLVDDDGKKWLKLRSSSFCIAKLILGHDERFKGLKNPSLSACAQIKEILCKIKAAVMDSQQGDLSDAEGSMFDGPQPEEVEEQEGKLQRHKRKLQQMLAKAPASLVVQLGESEAEIKTPKSWKETDITVRLETASLTAVCNYIMLDVAACFTEKKRSYKRTGQHCKVAKCEYDGD